MLAYTYISPGKFELIDKPKPELQGPRVVPHTHGRGGVVPQPCGLVTLDQITCSKTNSLVYIIITFLIVIVTSKLFIRMMSENEYG